MIFSLNILFYIYSKIEKYFLFLEIIRQLRIDPFGVDSLVEIHEHSVLASQIVVECALHVAMSAKRLADVTSLAPFRSQFDWFEPINVLFKKPFYVY